MLPPLKVPHEIPNQLLRRPGNINRLTQPRSYQRHGYRMSGAGVGRSSKISHSAHGEPTASGGT